MKFDIIAKSALLDAAPSIDGAAIPPILTGDLQSNEANLPMLISIGFK
ncbi:MAG: hypothetical protein LBU32_14250 [Clostridiales bacterium]|nr:hypothetical protein [Clostridiales bacterium]